MGNDENSKINQSEINLKYKIGDNYRIKIFGKKFIENNKNNCKIIIENKEYELSEYFIINDNLRKSEILEIKLIITKNINNLSFIFGSEFFLKVILVKI